MNSLALSFLFAHQREARVLKLRVLSKQLRHTNPKRKRGNGLRPLSSSLALRVSMGVSREKVLRATSKSASEGVAERCLFCLAGVSLV